MQLVILSCVVVAAIFSPSHVDCSAIEPLTELMENNAVIQLRAGNIYFTSCEYLILDKIILCLHLKIQAFTYIL